MTLDRRAMAAALATYVFWGIAPLYWALLADVAPLEVVAHRAVWGTGVFLAIAAMARRLRDVAAAFRRPAVVLRMALSAVLLSANWLLFVHAIETHRLLDASLGYYILPLVSVALGTLVLRERLRPLQWVAIALAGAGVAVLTIDAGGVPWIALGLASTFALYGLIRKTAPVDAIVGSTLETALVAVPAFAYLAAIGEPREVDVARAAILAGAGVVTALPLVLFASAARRLPLSAIGFLQYITPTLHIAVAVVLFDEPLTGVRLATFALIWLGVLAFSFELAAARSVRLAAARA